MRYEEIEHYLQEVLDLTPVVKPWASGNSLPYFLQDAYEFATIELLGVPHVLMLDRDRVGGASKVRKHMDTLAATTDAPCIYVAPTMNSYERKQLIGQRVPFIVPGNQLYLPDLGIDLREYFRQRRRTDTDKSLSPSTQALLISGLLRPWKTEVRPAELGNQLGYSPMALSRAVRELEQAELATVAEIGRERWIRFDGNARAVWNKASSRLRTPVKKRIWALSALTEEPRLAGESLLASHTLLAEPPHPVYAITPDQWKIAQKRGICALPSLESDACQWEIWRYSPDIALEPRSVDPLSLILSLREEPDERVQQALREFEENLPW